MTDAEILQTRRDAAESYIRSVSTVRWRSDTDLSYTHTASSTNPFMIVAGRLYEGIPYSYAGASLGAWLDHPGTMDDKGVYNMTGLSVELLGGTSTTSRLGIDCSGTVNRSWQSVGAAVRAESTNAMTVAKGFLRVGEYKSPDSTYQNTVTDCKENGTVVMYAAYALLQKADAVVMYNGKSGHAMFVVDVHVIRDGSGNIDGSQSTVTVIDQNGIMRENKKYYDEAAGEDVYVCLRVDYDFTFAKLFQQGYLPVTNKIFVDPGPVAEPAVSDSLPNPGKNNLFEGVIGCNWALDHVMITVTDEACNVVQSSLCHPQRRTCFAFKMSQFSKDSAGQLVGTLDLNTLPSGNYHCAVTCRTVAGHGFTVRAFDFAV